MMDQSADWDSVLHQYVADPYGFEDLDGTLGDTFPLGYPSPSYLHISSQAPAPPLLTQLSHDGVSVIESQEGEGEGDTVVSISTTFFPGTPIQSLPPDVVLSTLDAVYFYVHSHILLAASDNGFNSTLPIAQSDPSVESPPIISVSDESSVLNVILHAIYDMPCSHYSPTYQTLSNAVSRLPYYGIQPASRIQSSMPLFTLLLSHAPLHPLDLYALAAEFEMEALAIAVSSHLLSFNLSSITDELARRIGPVYLKRLFFLHLGRIEALKRILLPIPPPHPPTLGCNFEEQRKVTRAWSLASAYFAWDARPGASRFAI